jgi:hypothetical protein
MSANIKLERGERVTILYKHRTGAEEKIVIVFFSDGHDVEHTTVKGIGAFTYALRANIAESACYSVRV